MNGRPLPMSRIAAGGHGCLAVFVQFTGDLSSHCAPYVDVDEAYRDPVLDHTGANCVPFPASVWAVSKSSSR